MMAKRHLIVIAALLLPTPSIAQDAQDQNYGPPEAICADGAGWVDDDAGQVARTFEQAFAAFDGQFMAFSMRFTQSFGMEGQAPGEGEEAALSESARALQIALGGLLPSDEPDNTGGPLMFSLYQLSGENNSADRQEVLRAAFAREMEGVSMPGPRHEVGHFSALFEMTGNLLVRENGEPRHENETGSLHLLASGTLAESYDVDFRRPALRVLDEGWHTSLASRLRQHVRSMCEETAR